MAVEHELILAADQRAERDMGSRLDRAFGEQALPFGALAGVVGRGGDVNQQARPGRRLLGRGRSGLPQVLADGQTDAVSGNLDRRPRGPGGEVALLVEHAVVWEMNLAIDRLDGAVAEHRGGVVDTVVSELGEAYDRGRAGYLPCQV